MPHLLQNPHEEEEIRDRSQSLGQRYAGKHNMWGRTLQKVGSWLRQEEEHKQTAAAAARQINDKIAEGRRDGTGKSGREVVSSLPRPITFRRQDSERRERLVPHEPDTQERRACSVNRMRANTTSHEPFTSTAPLRPSCSLPEPRALQGPISSALPPEVPVEKPTLRIDTGQQGPAPPPLLESPLELYPPAPPHGALSDPDVVSENFEDPQLQAEVESKWILNLSMHFRDKSDREKFFITYAREPNKWLRVTVSLDYRDMQQDSLERDLKGLHYQRDKSARIYEAIRDSLPGIQFYPTVTNLKLQTRDGRLHVHVTEDVNEIIKYPPVSLVSHIPGPRIKESEVDFDSHLSGFVYKIRTCVKPGRQKLYIKKEIPGPDSVDEFLYEINALSNLKGSPYIIEYKAIVTSNDGESIKGLLIAYAPGGTLIDLLFDHRQDALYQNASQTLLSLERRLKHARQILCGLDTIHSAGFVQGDFTLSNIVLDAHDNARIIDINRRGCPVGWEPPELEPIIHSHGRVGMFIGVKSDLWQCGMVLWALGRGIDEPERGDDIGQWSDFDGQVEAEVPEWYKEVVGGALQPDPKNRKSAAELLAMFPEDWEEKHPSGPAVRRTGMLTPPRRMGHKEYIDPDLAVSHEDIAQGRASRSPVRRSHSRRSGFSASDMTFADEIATSTEYLFDSSGGSYVVGQRGEEQPRQTTAEAAADPIATEPVRTSGAEEKAGNRSEERTTAVAQVPQQYGRHSAEDILARRMSTGVPASLLTQKLQALAHTDSGFDEPKDEPKG